MSTFQVEKGVPIPANRSKTKYPIGSMQVGDSFLIPNINSGQGSGRVWGFNHNPNGWKYLSRYVTEGKLQGCRIWRIE